MNTVTVMEDSTYILGLYAAFSWPSGEDELVVIVLANGGSLCLVTRSSGNFETQVVCCGMFSDAICHKIINIDTHQDTDGLSFNFYFFYLL